MKLNQLITRLQEVDSNIAPAKAEQIYIKVNRSLSSALKEAFTPASQGNEEFTLYEAFIDEHFVYRGYTADTLERKTQDIYYRYLSGRRDGVVLRAMEQHQIVDASANRLVLKSVGKYATRADVLDAKKRYA